MFPQGPLHYNRLALPEFEAAMRQAHQAAQRAWPGVALSEGAFAARLRQLGVGPEELRTRGTDLFLAAACGAGLPGAIAAFERVFLSEVEGYVRTTGLTPDLLDELKQQLRVKLLTGPAPRIAEYRGHGPLGGWVRVCALRAALDLVASRKPAANNDPAAIEALVDDGVDPELAALKARYQPQFRAALEGALGALTAREKTLLRMHFLDGMSIDAMGVVYRVHRATIARWLAAARAKVMNSVSEKLSLDLQASSSDLHSLMGVLRSELDVSVRRIIAVEGGRDDQG